MKTILRSKRAISPVIATVILVAVAITVAVAVAYWMSGIAGMYTKFEKVEILSAYAPLNSALRRWEATLILKNTGSADATIVSAYVNNVPIGSWSPVITWNQPSQFSIRSGEQITLILYISTSVTSPSTLSSGTTINVKLHSAGGMDYIKLVELT